MSVNRDPDRKQQLASMALELFARKGYHNTKVSDVVKCTGVSQGTFYWHFESKEQLAIQIIRDGAQKLIQVIEQGYRKHAGTVHDMLESTTRLLTDLFEFANNNRHLMAFLLIKGQGADPSVREAVSQTWIEFEEAFHKNVKRALELGMLPDTVNLSLQVNILVSLITGVLAKWLFGPMHDIDFKSPFTPLEIAEETAKFEFGGLLRKI